ncbi:ATP cone domain-containing protein, partial [Herbiconiux daphne]
MARVIKRDGKVVDFDMTLIINAILKAQEAANLSNFTDAQRIATTVMNKYREQTTVNIGEIQRDVEALLLSSEPEVAHKYIEYRATRDRIREEKSPLAIAIKGLIEQTDEKILNENANKDSKVFPE